MNVRGNLALPLEEWTKQSRNEIEAIIDEKLKFVDFPETKDLMPAELSGGMEMQKRIAVARALRSLRRSQQELGMRSRTKAL